MSFEKAIQTRFETWDGLRVTAFIVERDNAHWVRFEANRAPLSDQASPQMPTATVDLDRELETFSELTKWAFQIPDHKLTEFVKRRGDFLKRDQELGVE